jgi:hypothetical protein
MRSLTSILTLAVLLGAAEQASAQDAATPDLQDELRTMVAEPAPAEQDRQVVRDFLERPDLETVAAEQGLDVARARAAVETMDDAVVADLARHVRSLGEDADLVGGNTVVISTTTIIIVLLILILVTD